jgi:hypothetical protein
MVDQEKWPTMQLAGMPEVTKKTARQSFVPFKIM